MKKMMTLMVMLTVALTMFAKDIKTVVFTTTPQMHCENCENKIKGNLKFEKGIKDIQTSVSEQKVTITYDADKTSETKLTEAFGKIGYKVSKVGTDKATASKQGCCQNGGQGCCKSAASGEKKDCCKDKAKKSTGKKDSKKKTVAKVDGTTGATAVKK